MQNLDDLDLNLLRLLQVVVEVKNTTLAAEQLGISQTTVSRGLAKLRQVFGDQLFVRRAHGVEPSELAEKLAEASKSMLNPVVKVVESYQSFNPDTYSGRLTIAVNVSILEVFGERIFLALKEALPQASFNLVYWKESSLAAVLNNEIDYFIHFSSYPLPQEIYSHKFFDIQMGIVARKGHPVLSESNEIDRIHSLPVARMAVDGLNSKRSILEDFYRSKGYSVDITLVTHSLSILMRQLKSSDAITYSSSYVAELDPDLESYTLPTLPLELRSMSVSGGYLQTRRGYPLNQYLHQVIQTCFDTIKRK